MEHPLAIISRMVFTNSTIPESKNILPIEKPSPFCVNPINNMILKHSEIRLFCIFRAIGTSKLQNISVK